MSTRAYLTRTAQLPEIGDPKKAPLTDIRIEAPWTWDWISRVHDLVAINLVPPASGPEIELTLGSSWVQVTEKGIHGAIEQATGKSVLAIRRRPTPPRRVVAPARRVVEQSARPPRPTRRMSSRMRGYGNTPPETPYLPPASEYAYRRDEYMAGYFSVPAGAPDREPTPEEIVEAEDSFQSWWADWVRGCDRCHRQGPALPTGARLQEVANGRRICIDCFCHLTKNGNKDPADLWTGKIVEEGPARRDFKRMDIPWLLIVGVLAFVALMIAIDIGAH